MRRGLIPFAVLGALAGLGLGVGGYTFVYAKGLSYMTNDPRACANCHVMQDHLDAWTKSSHRNVAACNDCHAPHDLVGKYATKARNGFWHSYAFTTGKFPEPFRITPRNLEIAEHACLDCHAAITDAIGGGVHSGPDSMSCTRCHQGVGHPKPAAEPKRFP